MAFRSLFKPKNSQKTIHLEAIIVVSGLPRSGTSLMMKMLEAGGLPVLTDHLRKPDDNNPKGYYEFERVKKLKDGDHDWLKESTGKAVKVISALLEHLPPQYTYNVIFMRRNMGEILASQKQMLIRRGEAPDKVSDEKLAALYQNHLAKIEAWLAQQPNFAVEYVSYNDVLLNPQENLVRVNRFLNEKLDIKSMATVIDSGLYRERSRA